MTLKFYILMAFLMLLIMPGVVAGISSEPATLRVTILVVDADDNPFSDLWLVLIADHWDGDDMALAAKTDEAGQAHFIVNNSDDIDIAFIRIAGRGSVSLVPYSDRQSVAAQDTTIIPNYGFPTFVTIPLEDGVTEYAATITMHPSVRASVQLVDQHGAPLGGGAFVQIGGFGMDTDENDRDESGPLSIGGLRRGYGAEVMILGPDTPQWKVIDIEPHQTLEDVDLGQVHIPPYQPGTVPMHMQLINDDQLSTRAVEWVRGSVTIFSEDGQVATIFAKSSFTGPIADLRHDEPPRVPLLDPGVYFVAPGPLGTSSATLLRRLLRDGVDVEAAGVPKLTAVEGEPIHITVDAVQVEQAIRAAAGQ
ncbi:MAG: hypothetical protein EA378_01085 [Phycisphaerales bacterium]|nr:MAG: hypothetical protein EA378_01085 [Phycisphaerales bacterium]